jgi:hypothetical protein
MEVTPSDRRTMWSKGAGKPFQGLKKRRREVLSNWRTLSDGKNQYFRYLEYVKAQVIMSTSWQAICIRKLFHCRHM